MITIQPPTFLQCDKTGRVLNSLEKRCQLFNIIQAEQIGEMYNFMNIEWKYMIYDGITFQNSPLHILKI